MRRVRRGAFLSAAAERFDGAVLTRLAAVFSFGAERPRHVDAHRHGQTRSKRCARTRGWGAQSTRADRPCRASAGVAGFAQSRFPVGHESMVRVLGVAPKRPIKARNRGGQPSGSTSAKELPGPAHRARGPGVHAHRRDAGASPARPVAQHPSRSHRRSKEPEQIALRRSACAIAEHPDARLCALHAWPTSDLSRGTRHCPVYQVNSSCGRAKISSILLKKGTSASKSTAR
jgi:hypothetical protein